MKKHENQMTGAEKTAIAMRVAEIAATVISTHAADRMDQKGVSGKEIEICLKYGHAVEMHDEANELRAVIRHSFGKPKVAVCVVIGLESGTIVTTWKNAGSDSHSTLNMFAYDKSMNICAMLGAR
ncbi:MAG: DUF4258 domain-containing protein [Candidatus Paceibacteria bacterium]